MRRCTAVACAVVLGLSVTGAMAQNARLNSLGSNPILSDFGNVLWSPAYMLDYQDAIQATYNGAVGPVMGVKALGDVVSVGLTYDQARVLSNLNNAVYGIGAPSFLDALNATTQLAGQIANADIDPMPHFLLGASLGKVKLGLDLYWERAFYKYELDQTIATVTTTTTASGDFSHLGAQLGANLELGDALVAIGVGLGLPRASGEYHSTVGGVAAPDETAETESGITMRGNIDGYFPLLNMDCMVSAYGSLLKFATREITSGVPVDVVSDEFLTAEIGLILAVQHEFEEHGIILALGETTSMFLDKVTPFTPAVPGNVDVLTNTVGVDVVASVEKNWTELKRLDAISGRCALTYGTSWDVVRESGSVAADNIETREQTPADRAGFGFVLGAGMTKGILQLDVEVNVAEVLDAISWSTGNAGGNDLLTATLTLDFKNLSKSGRSDAAQESAPAPAPAPEGGLSF